MKHLITLLIIALVAASCGKTKKSPTNTTPEVIINPQGAETGLFNLTSINKNQINDLNSLIGLWETPIYHSNSLYFAEDGQLLTTIPNDPIKKQLRVKFSTTDLTVTKKCTGTDGQIVYAQVQATVQIEQNGDVTVTNQGNKKYIVNSVAMNNGKICHVHLSAKTKDQYLAEQAGEFLFSFIQNNSGVINLQTFLSAGTGPIQNMNKINN